MSPSHVAIDCRAREAFGAPNSLPPGSFFQSADGQILRVEADGNLERLQRGGSPWGRSLASVPSAAALICARPHRASPNRPTPGSQPGRVATPRGADGAGSEAGVSGGTP